MAFLWRKSRGRGAAERWETLLLSCLPAIISVFYFSLFFGRAGRSYPSVGALFCRAVGGKVFPINTLARRGRFIGKRLCRPTLPTTESPASPLHLRTGKTACLDQFGIVVPALREQVKRRWIADRLFARKVRNRYSRTLFAPNESIRKASATIVSILYASIMFPFVLFRYRFASSSCITPLLYKALIAARTVGTMTPNNSAISYSVIAMRLVSVGTSNVPVSSHSSIFLFIVQGRIWQNRCRSFRRTLWPACRPLLWRISGSS